MSVSSTVTRVTRSANAANAANADTPQIITRSMSKMIKDFECISMNTRSKTCRTGKAVKSAKSQSKNITKEDKTITNPQKIKKEEITTPKKIKKDAKTSNAITLSIGDIELFDRKTKQSKADNDKNNRIRERILYEIVSDLIPKEWYKNTQWKTLANKFNTIIRDICDIKDITKIDIQTRGGRKYNYDFTIYYYKDDIVVDEKNIEFKYNANKINKAPQFLSVASKHFTKGNGGYAEYFYDNYRSDIAALANVAIPSKTEYMKYIYGNNYDKLEFFIKLKEAHPKIIKEKKRIVNSSIKKYLTDVVKLDIDSINEKFSITNQIDKHYIMYKDGVFYTDKIQKKELDVKKIEKLKNNNSIVLETKSASKICMLLRWKNHSGILGPAWQISLNR